MKPGDRRRSRAAGVSRSRLEVTVSDEWGWRVATATGLGRWLAWIAPVRARGIVNVALVSDARVRALNRQYRDRDYATDVLSFPAQSLTPHPCLGDIVIAQGVARRQAQTARHSHGTELRVLALHGLLHLLGYDHEQDAGTMARVERRLRAKGGLPAGLLERRPRRGQAQHG